MARSLLNKNRYECSNLTSDLDRLFSAFFKPEEWTASSSLAPRINVSESETEYEISADLPGVKPDDVQVELHEGDLTISGKREDVEKEEGKTYHRVERRAGEFRRVISLPAAVDPDKIEARFENGVLSVLLPKSAEVLPKRIQVKPSKN